VSLAAVKGTGKHGRVTKEDVLNFVESGGKPTAPRATTKQEAPIAAKTDKVIKLTGRWKELARNMTDSLVIPHDNIMDFVDMTSIKRAMKTFMEMYPKKQIDLMPFAMKALSCALLDYPLANALTGTNKGKDGIATEYVEKAEHNMGIVIDTPEGPLVPNIKSVQRKSILQINEELRELMERVSKSTLTQSDLSGSTFTLCHINCISGFPRIYTPQTTILGLGKQLVIPGYITVKGATKMVPKEVFTLNLTCDHRIIDGATSVKFINQIKQYLEQLELLIMRLK